MNNSINLMNSIWYGSIGTEIEIKKLKNILPEISSEKDCILIINELLKAGDFSVKSLLIQLLNTTKDENILNLGVRLFCSILDHDDLLDSNHFQFLSDASEEIISTFSSSAIDTMSYHVIPYLLALLEEWDDTNVEEDLRNSLEIYLGYTKDVGENASPEEIGEIYSQYVKRIDVDKYYYFKNASFPGTLAKELIQASVESMNHRKPLGMDLNPTLLSIWSGMKCPVEYNDIVDEKQYKEVVNYVTALSNKNWEIGGKYFYGKQIG